MAESPVKDGSNKATAAGSRPRASSYLALLSGTGAVPDGELAKLSTRESLASSLKALPVPPPAEVVSSPNSTVAAAAPAPDAAATAAPAPEATAPAAAPAPQAVAPAAGLDEAERRRLDKVLAEIRVTERTYVDALSSFVAFLPLLQQHLADVQLLTTVGALHGVHRELMTQLDKAHETRGQSDPTAYRLPLLWPNAPKPSDSRHADADELTEAEAEAESAAAREVQVRSVASSFAQLTPFLRMYST